MVKKYLIFSDVHLETLREIDNSYLLFKEVCKKVRPNRIICLGDLLDFSYISHFADVGETEGKRLSDDIAIFRKELSYFKKCSKEPVIFLSGNHCDRLEKLLNKNPVLKGIVDLKEICSELGIVYITTSEQPYKLLDDLYITHGLTYTKHFCSKLADSMGTSVITGHTHRNQMFVNSYPDGRIIESYGIGSLTSITEYYERGKRITGHSNGFGELLVDEDTGQWNFNIIIIKNNKCFVDGKLYTLETPSD